MKRCEIVELTFTGKRLLENWADIDLSAVFSSEGESITVKGFYDGNGKYKIRFLPKRTGHYFWKTTGVIEESGEFNVEPGSGKMLIRAEGHHFVDADGNTFIPVGTTVYALVHQEEALIHTTFESLEAAPFNKLRFCVFPKHYDYNHNEPIVYPFLKREDGSWDVTRPCVEYWQHLESCIEHLHRLGIQSDLILFHPYDRWGFDKLSQEENLLYLDYLIRRLSAYPNIWWSLANEYDLSPNKTIADWTQIESYVADHDPFRHLLSIHNAMGFWDYSRPNITHVSLQTQLLTRVQNWQKKYNKPIVVDECCYEGNIDHMWGSISARELVFRFWRVMSTGGYCTHGETYYDQENEILWWAKGGVLKGESPERIAFLKAVFEELPGPVEPELSQFIAMFDASDEELASVEQMLPDENKVYIRSLRRLMEDKEAYRDKSYEYKGKVGKDDAFIIFYDIRTCSWDTLELPETATYRIDLIDVWEMTRTVLQKAASGKTKISLPGREGMAVICRKNAL